MPNYLVPAADDSVVLRNYEGVLVRYNPTGTPIEDRPLVATQGVSALLAGQGEALIPEGNPRHQRRALSTSFSGEADDNSNANGQVKRRPMP